MGDSANAARHALELKKRSDAKSFAELIDEIKNDRRRYTVQPRLAEGLRLALAITRLEGIPAKSMTWQRFATAEREILLNSHSSIDADCRPFGRPMVTLLTPPAHGSISVREMPLTVGRLQRGRLGTKDCRGVHNVGIGVYYQPDPGFRGNDQVIYRVSFPSTIYFDDTIDIMVFP
jgi:hypothetical protein